MIGSVVSKPILLQSGHLANGSILLDVGKEGIEVVKQMLDAAREMLLRSQQALARSELLIDQSEKKTTSWRKKSAQAAHLPNTPNNSKRHQISDQA